jgi:hypothetical protein
MMPDFLPETVRLIQQVPTHRVVLLMVPFAGYDRGLLRGIAQYAEMHGPWMF